MRPSIFGICALLIVVFAAPAVTAADAIVSGQGAQCVTWGLPHLADGASRQQAILKDCTDSSAAYSVASSGDIVFGEKCLVAGDATLRASSLVYLGPCGSPASQWIYQDGRIVNRVHVSKVLSAFWGANVTVAERSASDPNQTFRLGRIIDIVPPAGQADGGGATDPKRTVIRRGRRGKVARGTLVELVSGRSIEIHR